MFFKEVPQRQVIMFWAVQHFALALAILLLRWLLCKGNSGRMISWSSDSHQLLGFPFGKTGTQQERVSSVNKG